MVQIFFYKVDQEIESQAEKFCRSSFVQKVGFVTSDNYKEASKLLINEYFDIVVVDSNNSKAEVLDLMRGCISGSTKVIVISPSEDEAFEYINFNVLGFLVRPIEALSLITLLNRCLNTIFVQLEMDQLKLGKDRFQRFVSINSINKIELIRVEDISYFEADGRYTVVHLKNDISKVASKNLGEFQKLLNPDVFCRIHHKFIINLDNLHNIIKSDGYYCEMRNNKNVPVSKRKLENLNSILNSGKVLA
ncbi:MAG: LytTR family transcriptional regulator DNA-binding domain-containing protein [Flavobacteriaceae bacterium]|nr:LytTR family transcriptional regulator DNA-binding domain-containing protein [Flavobacteriaceae bacterium]